MAGPGAGLAGLAGLQITKCLVIVIVIVILMMVILLIMKMMTVLLLMVLSSATVRADTIDRHFRGDIFQALGELKVIRQNIVNVVEIVTRLAKTRPISPCGNF